MKNQYKSANPADLSCHGENCNAGAWPNSDDHSVECVKESAISQGWDVPPAGDVEVLPKRREQPNGFTAVGWANLRGWNAYHDAAAPLFTRLNAELTLERTRADVAVADCNDAENAGRKVSQLLSDRTAERDGLADELSNLRDLHSEQTCVFCNDSGELRTKVTALQSELTKARELIEEVRKGYEPVLSNYMAGKLLAFSIAHNADESCGQDAEAAKGGV